jgi:hypothetical protein
MSLLLLMLAPLITADGVNIGKVHRECTDRAARAILQSSRNDEQVADYAMAKCRHLEPRLKEGLDLSWRRDRTGKVSSSPSNLSKQMTKESWGDLLKAKRDRLIEDVHKAREYLRKRT